MSPRCPPGDRDSGAESRPQFPSPDPTRAAQCPPRGRLSPPHPGDREERQEGLNHQQREKRPAGRAGWALGTAQRTDGTDTGGIGRIRSWLLRDTNAGDGGIAHGEPLHL